ncbi:GTP-binding protein [Candidatus Woesearchaeota archaeon CG_4_10_14_0_2_um_filter_33_10]|nr:MAG: GTP-binding protein [Candidatus Woesearchaeota archaeon CG10_big_fil_rev_8_21_14_0_10_33_12]PIU72479.1 MAG: GTP-binding protein [Candidatus Woesearchaeota archaeon CG06_land_8_20_14_3_00_33_13]PIZ52838.1 MAG: GTP-binding protein [Candidatus Woesearchaeota archaeon CG_4_10_14_0_2_um_filter_33_10]
MVQRKKSKSVKLDKRLEKQPEKKTNYDKIREFEHELSTTKYNKRTQHHIGLVKAKIANLKKKELARSESKGKKEGYSVRKTGDGTVIILGFPSVGKSTLLNKITNANSPVGSYDFTTLSVIPGTMDYKHAKIQILDVPGVVSGAASGRGRGKEVLAVMRNCDLVLVLLDINRLNEYKVLCNEVYETGIRMNQKKPDIRIKKKSRGGIRIGKTVQLPDLDDETIKDIMKEFSISNAEVLIRTQINADQLIDCIESNKKYVNAIIVINKIDLATTEQIEDAKRKFPDAVLICANNPSNIDELKENIYRRLELISIYLKEVGKKADLDVPLVINRNCTIEDVCNKLHKDFVTKFKFARVWGKSAKFGGQMLRLKHNLLDEDIVEIHLR